MAIRMDWLRRAYDAFLKQREVVKEEKAEAIVEDRRIKIRESVRAAADAMPATRQEATVRGPVRVHFDVRPYQPPKGVAPASHVLAMDAAYSGSGFDLSMFTGSGFPGYSYLTELAQITEYRDMSERIAAEMTRKWVKLRATGDEDRSKQIKQLEEEMRRLGVRDAFRRAAELDGQQGRGQIFMDFGQVDGPELGKPLVLDKMKITKGSLRAIKIVEPINTYPHNYNSTNPLADDYYNPSTWYVQSIPVHATRLLTFIGRPLPNALKPAYNFGGMSISQLAQPYVDYWFSTRDSVGRLLKNFSTTVLKTNMADVMSGGAGDDFLARVRLFLKMRDNQNILVMDKNSEDFAQYNVPLSGLETLQAQSQEHMAAVAKMPLVVLLGISPTGLNASSEGEIRAFYDYNAEQQEKLFRSNLETLIKVMQLSLFGEIHDDIVFDFVSLYTPSAAEQSTMRTSDAATGKTYIDGGVITPEEERKRIASDPDSGYSLDMTKVVPKPAPATPDAAKDQAIFFGNQHTGPLAGGEDTPYAEAVKASSVAARASAVAVATGHKRSHERALQAHQRALDLQTAALEDPLSSGLNYVHEEYIRAHSEYIVAHAAAIKACQDRIDKNGGVE